MQLDPIHIVLSNLQLNYPIAPFMVTLEVEKTIVSSLAVLTIWSCSQKTTFLPSSQMPTAQGHVKIRKDYNSDYGVSLNVMNLTSAEMLSPAKTNYVLWAESADVRPESMGKFQSYKRILSRSSKGKLESIVSTEPIRFFITGRRKRLSSISQRPRNSNNKTF